MKETLDKLEVAVLAKCLGGVVYRCGLLSKGGSLNGSKNKN